MNTARFWRNRGNDLLIVFLAVEFILEIWPEIPSDWSPWIPPNKFQRWLGQHLSWKRNLTMLATFMIVLGVALERYEGSKADDFADRISASLEEYIVSVLPRERLLTSEVRKQMIAALQPFAGQRIAVVMYRDGDPRRDTVEIAFLQIGVADILDKAGWLNPWGKKIMEPQSGGGGFACKDCLEVQPKTPMFAWGISIYIDPHAFSETRKAATALESVLAEHRLQANWTSSFPLPVPFTNDQNLIVLQIGDRP